MAILEKIRERTVLVLVLIGGAIALFVVDPDKIVSFFQNSSDPDSIGSIYEEDINRDEFDKILKLIKQSTNYANYPEEFQYSKAWDQIIQDKLIASVSEVVGIDVTGKEIYEMETGVINQANLNLDMSNWFSQCNCNEDFIEDLRNHGNKYSEEDKKNFLGMELEVIKYRYLQKYQTLIEKGIYTTNAEVNNFLNSQSQNTVKYVAIPYTTIIEDVDITELDITRYYSENISDYQNDQETRNVECVIFQVAPSNEDDIKTREGLDYLSTKLSLLKDNDDEDFVNRYSSESIGFFPYLKAEDITDPKFKDLISKSKGTVIGPYKLTNGKYRLSKLSDDTLRSDKVEVSQILISQETIKEIGDSAAYAMIDDCKTRVRNGEDFGLLASQISEGAEKSNFGYVGEISETDQLFNNPQYEPELIEESNRRFISACFDAKKEGALRTLITIDGFHLLKITKFIDVQQKYKIVYLDKEIIASDNTRKNIHYKAQEFIKSFNEKSADISFQSFATSEEYEKDAEFYPSGNLGNMKFKIKDLDNSRAIVKWMFNSNTKRGDISNSIYTCGDNYVVACLSDINSKGNRPLESVKEEITQQILKQKRFDIISKKIPSGSTIEDLAIMFNSKVDTIENVNFANLNVFNPSEIEENFVGVVNSFICFFSKKIIDVFCFTKHVYSNPKNRSPF